MEAVIQQGELADCYLLGALSAVARCPERRAALFASSEWADVGFYAVQFWKEGEPLVVLIDDRLPIGHDGELLFARCSDDAPWAPLVEKAYAKLHRGYGWIAVGTEAEALADLTGAVPLVQVIITAVVLINCSVESDEAPNHQFA